MTGFSPSVLRAWERRHHLLAPERLASGHRLYTQQDLEIIQRVKDLLSQGRTIGEIAALGRISLLSQEPELLVKPNSNRMNQLREELLDAAEKLNSQRFDSILDEAFSKFSVELVIRELIVTTATEVGERWAAGTLTIASEHLLTASLTNRIERIRHLSTMSAYSAPLVACACLTGEQHELGLMTLSLLVQNAGYRVAYLGRNLPLKDLKDTAEQLKVAAVCLSVKQVEVLDALQEDLIKLAREWKDSIRIHIGGANSIGAKPALEEAGICVWSPAVKMSDFINRLVGKNQI